MNGGNVEGRWMTPDSDDPFEKAILAFAETILRLAEDAFESGVRVDVVLTGTAIALVRIAEKCGQKEVCADMLEHYVTDLRSDVPIFHEGGGTA